MKTVFRPTRELLKEINNEKKEDYFESKKEIPEKLGTSSDENVTELFPETNESNLEDEWVSWVEESRDFGKDLYKVVKSPDEYYEKDDMGIVHAKEYGTVEITPQGDIFGDYSDLRRFLHDCELTDKRSRETLTMEAHHLIQEKHLEQVGFSSKDGICVGVFAPEHMESIHNYVLDSNIDFNTVDELKTAYLDAYNENDLPEWGHRASGFIEKHREVIARSLKESVENKANKEAESLEVEEPVTS